MPALIIKEGPEAGRRFEFQGSIEIGRERGNDLTIEDRTISRRHAAVSVHKDGVLVTDLKSQNGTRVNGKLIRVPTPLKHGDELQTGGVLMQYRDDTPPPDESSFVELDDSAQEVLQSIVIENPMASVFGEAGARSVAALSQRLQLMYDVSAALHHSLEERVLLSLVLGKLFEVFPVADRGAVLLHDPERGELTPGAVQARAGVPAQVAVSRTLVWNVVNSRIGVLVGDALSDARFNEAQSIVRLGLRSVLCVPMIADNEVLGVIALDSLRSSGAFRMDDMTLLVGIAAQAALALSRARLHQRLLGRELMERDLALAKKIQARFLPQREPERPGWGFEAYYCSALDVGGDYYDFLDLPQNHVGMAIGDVSGKGISAALYMVKLSSELRYQSAGQTDPGEVLRRVNRALARDIEEGMFVTCLMLVADVGTGRLRVASAGHMAPLLRRPDGSVVELSVPRTPPLAVNEAAFYPTREFSLEPGDTVVVYTDGISEAERPGGELFGEDRLVEAIAASEGGPAGVLKGVLDAVQAYAEDAPQADDTTLLCFGRTTTSVPAGVSTWPMSRIAAQDD